MYPISITWNIPSLLEERMRAKLLGFFLILSILTAAQFVYGQPGKLEIVGEVRFPNFIKVGEKVQIKMNVKGGPVDENKVTVIMSYEVRGLSQRGSGGHNYSSWEVKGVITNDTVVFPYEFREPGGRNNVTCKIRYSVGGKIFETKAVPVNSFEVER